MTVCLLYLKLGGGGGEIGRVAVNLTVKLT